jgi:hypothetical protein
LARRRSFLIIAGMHRGRSAHAGLGVLAPVLLCALGASSTGCSRSAPTVADEPSELELRSAAAEPAPRERIDPAAVGGIRGRVTFEGEPPEPRAIPLVRECKLHDEPLYAETLVVGPDGGLRDVLVHVRRGLAAWEIPPPAPDAPAPRLDQVGCRYVPHVLALRAGQTLFVANSDPLAHNVHLRAPRNGLDANRSQGRGAPELELAFTRRELDVRVACDLHPWMGAVVHVLDHPFYAVTDASGAFALAGLPPGEYEIEALHAKLGKRRATVTVAAGADVSLDLGFATR